MGVDAIGNEANGTIEPAQIHATWMVARRWNITKPRVRSLPRPRGEEISRSLEKAV